MPRKTPTWSALTTTIRPASMRPRPDAAENVAIITSSSEGCLPLQ